MNRNSIEHEIDLMDVLINGIEALQEMSKVLQITKEAMIKMARAMEKYGTAPLEMPDIRRFIDEDDFGVAYEVAVDTHRELEQEKLEQEQEA